MLRLINGLFNHSQFATENKTFCAYWCMLVKYWRLIQTDFLTKFAEKDTKHRSSHPEVFCKVDILKNFVKFAGKHLCRSLFIKVQTEALQLS